MKPINETKGFFYIKTKKSKSKTYWYLWHETSEDGKRVYKSIPKFTYGDYGFSPSMTLTEAKKRATRLNKERSFQRDEVRQRINSAKNLLTLESLDNVLFPIEYVTDFGDQLEDENFGSDSHLKKLRSQFNFIQKMVISLRLTPDQYKEKSKRVYKFLIEEKVSIDYGNKLISMMNRWGQYLSRQQNQYFEPVPAPKGRVRSAIADAQRSKSGKDTELGVRTESEPLTPEILKLHKDKFTNPEHWNFLFIGLWFGLRPHEIDLLKDKTKWKVIKDKDAGIMVLRIYQTKLMEVEESKRYKSIPILFKEQHDALTLVKQQVFSRPHSKTVRKNLQANITLYGGRKGFTDLMLNREQRIEDISLWLGHRNITTTWKHYKDREKVSFVKTKGMKYS